MVPRLDNLLAAEIDVRRGPKPAVPLACAAVLRTTSSSPSTRANDIWDSQDSYGCGITPAITAGQIIEGFRTLISAAHARGIKVVGATILPFKRATNP
jgi:hypothetical protein